METQKINNIKELRKQVALFFYNANYPDAYTNEEIAKYEKQVDAIMSLFEEFTTPNTNLKDK